MSECTVSDASITQTPQDEFRSQIQEFTNTNDGWVIDGNYRNAVGDVTLSLATTIVCMAFSLATQGPLLTLFRDGSPIHPLFLSPHFAYLFSLVRLDPTL
jgi:hypothetical protein